MDILLDGLRIQEIVQTVFPKKKEVDMTVIRGMLERRAWYWWTLYACTTSPELRSQYHQKYVDIMEVAMTLHA